MPAHNPEHTMARDYMATVLKNQMTQKCQIFIAEAFRFLAIAIRMAAKRFCASHVEMAH
jgi:hypothetical protein